MKDKSENKEKQGRKDAIDKKDKSESKLEKRKKETEELNEKKETEHDSKGLQEIPSDRMRDAFVDAESREWEKEKLSEGLKQLANDHQETSSTFQSDLQRSLGLSQKELEEFREAFQETREALDKNGEVRYGMVNERLYGWKPDLDPTRLENAYGELYYYFRDKAAFEKYIADAGKALGLEGQDQKEIVKQLRELASQMVLDKSHDYCINSNLNRIRGDHVHLLNDLSGKSLSDLEGKISKITKMSGKGGIENPKFPQGEKLQVALSRLTANAITDCHLKANGTLEYYEKEMSRIRIVEKDLQEFGNIRLNPKLRKGENLYVSYFPTPLGKALQSLGIPPGDRTVQNHGLFSELKKFSRKAQCALIEDIIPQDGTVYRKRILWTHSNVLDSANKSEIYGIESKIGKRQVELIKDYGKREKHGWVLRYGKLNEIQNSGHVGPQQEAEKLRKIVYENKNKLIQDQLEIAKNLGIQYQAKPYAIRYHERTGRVSVSWTAEPKGVLESIKLGMLAPPNDVVKRELVKDLIRNNQDHMKRAMKQFSDYGIDVRRWWETE
ncbi:MAG: hypothetical protein ACXADD_14480 [Candidatus Thorarchaeota archaeon]